MATKKQLNIKKAREISGYTQQAVADMLQITRESYARYESGDRNPSYDVLGTLAGIFGVSTDYLLCRADVSLNNDLSSDELELITAWRDADPAMRIGAMAVLRAKQSKSSAIPSINKIRASKDGSDCRKRVEGAAAAGAPITAVALDGETVSVPKRYLDARFFIVRAKGISMEPRIRNGSYCVFNSDAAWDAGDVVFVRVEGATDQSDVLIKRIYPCGDKVRLESINPTVAPMFFPAADVSVGGVFIDTL